MMCLESVHRNQAGKTRQLDWGRVKGERGNTQRSKEEGRGGRKEGEARVASEDKQGAGEWRGVTFKPKPRKSEARFQRGEKSIYPPAQPLENWPDLSEY